jgi:flavodoxin
MPQALIVYYSYTHQAARAADAIADGLRDSGWEVTAARLEFADGPLEFPLSPLPRRAKELSDAALKGVQVPVRFDESVLTRRYDLVLIGSPTWNHAPATPVASFLRTPAARQVLSGTPFGVFVTCRGFWRVNRRRVRRLGEQVGGRFLGGVGLTFDGSFPRTMHAFLHGLLGRTPEQPLAGVRPTAFGLSEATLARGREFALVLARRAAPVPTAPA